MFDQAYIQMHVCDVETKKTINTKRILNEF